MKLEDLVVLQYAPNNCYVQVKDIKDLQEQNELVINLDKMFWSYRGWKDNKIGSSRSIYGDFGRKYKSGIIGVYDRNNTQHLNALAGDVKEFTECDCLSFYD